MIKFVIIFLLIVNSALSNEVINKEYYKKIMNKSHKSKEAFLLDVREYLVELNKKNKQEYLMNLTEKKVIININKQNYARLINQYTYFFLNNYFNYKQDRLYSSIWLTISNLSLNEGKKFLQSNNPEIILDSMKKGDFVKILFNNKSLKSIINSKNGNYTSVYTVELNEYKNHKKTKSYWTEINLQYKSDNTNIEITKIELKIN